MARFKIKRFFSNPVSSIVNLVKDTVSGIGNLVSDMAEALKKEINNAVKFIEDKVKDITQSIENMVQKTLDGIKDVYDKIKDETTRLFEKAEGFIKDGIDSIQTSFTKITSSLAESLLPDFLEQSVKNNLKFASDFIATYLKNSVALGSSLVQLDLKSAEDDLKKMGKDFDDQFHDGLKLIEDNANSYVDLLQYTRDEVVRPVWNITRENLSSIAHTIEKEAIRPAINNLIHEIDLLVEVTMPDQLAKQYERAKSAVEDATLKLREIRKDVNESLEQFEEEVKKAGKLIDDMKVVIIQTAAIIGYAGNEHIEGLERRSLSLKGEMAAKMRTAFLVNSGHLAMPNPGRGDIDLLIGGQGDDEIFGGNSDDQLYGSEGSDKRRSYEVASILQLAQLKTIANDNFLMRKPKTRKQIRV